jgi:uncharacterized protein YqhQ
VRPGPQDPAPRFADPGLPPEQAGVRAYVGGQAILEGVMMRAPRALAVCVRRPDGSLVLRETPWVPLFARWPLVKRPFARGAAVMIESMWNGLSALNFSARVAELDAHAHAHAHAHARDATRGARPADATAAPDTAALGALALEAESPESRRARAASMALAAAIAIALFVGLPHALAAFGGAWLGGGDAPTAADARSVSFHVLDGAFKLAIFVGYIALVRRIPEIRRVFQYHGAEHKAVTTYEERRPLTVDGARPFGTFHARCGTSFVLFVLVVSIVLVATVLPALPPVSDAPLVQHLFLVVIKLPLMIPVAGVAYELNRFAAEHPRLALVQALVTPGRWMQRLTTAAPTDDQVEVALTALRAALAGEAEAARGGAPPAGVQTLRDFTQVEARWPATPSSPARVAAIGALLLVAAPPLP